MVQDKFPPMISKTFHYCADSEWKTCEKYLLHALNLEHNFHLLEIDLGQSGVLLFESS